MGTTCRDGFCFLSHEGMTSRGANEIATSVYSFLKEKDNKGAEEVDPEGVEKLLSNIDPKKANGPDGVPSIILKCLSMELAPVVSHIFQQSLDMGDVPTDWLIANITAIFKKGDKSIPANYRPMSLTSVTCKSFEHIIFHHIMSHLEKHNVLSSFQHGLRAQHSCESQLIITVDDLANNLNKKVQTDVLILDFQKAFDTVPHQRLLQKLESYGIRGNILNWITKWLTSRTVKPGE